MGLSAPQRWAWAGAWLVTATAAGAPFARSRVGDSMSLVRRAYPALKCDEGDAGSDEPVPYPHAGRTGPRVYLYVSGDYMKPGTPAAQIWPADLQI